MRIPVHIFFQAILFSALSLTALSCSKEHDKHSKPKKKKKNTVPSARIYEDGDSITVKTLGAGHVTTRYNKRKFYARPSSTLNFTLINNCQVEHLVHNLVIVKNGFTKKAAMEGLKEGEKHYYVPDSLSYVYGGSPLAYPGDTLSFTLKMPSQPGKYHFVSTYPGHWKRMKGTLVIVEP